MRGFEAGESLKDMCETGLASSVFKMLLVVLQEVTRMQEECSCPVPVTCGTPNPALTKHQVPFVSQNMPGSQHGSVSFISEGFGAVQAW